MQLEPLTTLTDLLGQVPLPRELEITILPFPDGINNISFLKDGIHLGIHAPHVPELAREFRKVYYGLRRHPANADVTLKSWMDSTLCLLLLCPDHATAWSDRKRALLEQKDVSYDGCRKIDKWGKELKFLDLLFTQHSKAPNAWSHRRWVCKQIVRELNETISTSDLCLPLDIFFNWAKCEINGCVQMAEKYPKNYYAWTHRSFIIRKLSDMMRHDEGQFDASVRSIIRTEADSIEPWLRRHVSDHSAAHYGGEVNKLWLSIGKKNHSSDDAKRWRVREILQMLNSSHDLIEKFQSHEVIWIWRRIIASLLFSFLTNEDLESVFRSEVMENFINDEISMVIQREDSYCSSELSKMYASSYILWIAEYAKQLNLDDVIGNRDVSILHECLPADKHFLLCLVKNRQRVTAVEAPK